MMKMIDFNGRKATFPSIKAFHSVDEALIVEVVIEGRILPGDWIGVGDGPLADPEYSLMRIPVSDTFNSMDGTTNHVRLMIDGE